MQSLPVLVLFVSLLQGSVHPQLPSPMSDSTNSPFSLPCVEITAASASNRPQEVEFKLRDYKWHHRLVLLFAPSNRSLDYQQQIQAWQAHKAGILDRDLLLVEVLGTGTSLVDGHPLTPDSVEALRRRFGVVKDQFVVLLVGKDGTEKQRSHSPFDLTLLFQAIDSMPMRQHELRSQL
jgi:hypothetical protein